MDIQKQAFEKAFKEQLGATHYQFDCDENGDYEDRETLCGWLLWQQAQKQAIPEGFVLVEAEKLNEIRDQAMTAKYASLNNDSDRIFGDIEDIQISIERLIEAQEQVG